MPPAMLALAPEPPPIQRAILAGAQKYTKLTSVPILAIYAVPHELPVSATDPGRAMREAQDLETTGVQGCGLREGRAFSSLRLPLE